MKAIKDIETRPAPVEPKKKNFKIITVVALLAIAAITLSACDRNQNSDMLSLVPEAPQISDVTQIPKAILSPKAISTPEAAPKSVSEPDYRIIDIYTIPISELVPTESFYVKSANPYDPAVGLVISIPGKLNMARHSTSPVQLPEPIDSFYIESEKGQQNNQKIRHALIVQGVDMNQELYQSHLTPLHLSACYAGGGCPVPDTPLPGSIFQPEGLPRPDIPISILYDDSLGGLQLGEDDVDPALPVYHISVKCNLEAPPPMTPYDRYPVFVDNMANDKRPVSINNLYNGKYPHLAGHLPIVSYILYAYDPKTDNIFVRHGGGNLPLGDLYVWIRTAGPRNSITVGNPSNVVHVKCP